MRSVRALLVLLTAFSLAASAAAQSRVVRPWVPYRSGGWGPAVRRGSVDPKPSGGFEYKEWVEPAFPTEREIHYQRHLQGMTGGRYEGPPPSNAHELHRALLKEQLER